MKTTLIALSMLASSVPALAQGSYSYTKQKSADERFSEQIKADSKRMEKEASDKRQAQYNRDYGVSQRTGVTGSLDPKKKEGTIGYQKSIP